MITANHTTIAGLIEREGRTAKLGWVWVGLTAVSVGVFVWALFVAVTWPPSEVQVAPRVHLTAPG